MERNKELFYKIADAIEQNPSHHYQSSWIRVRENPSLFARRVQTSDMLTLEVNGEQIEHCGTTQCVAGWAAVLDGQGERLAIQMGEVSGDNEEPFSVIKSAACALGIDADEANTLFVSSAGHTESYDWPAVLRALGDGTTVKKAFTDNYIGGQMMQGIYGETKRKKGRK